MLFSAIKYVLGMSFSTVSVCLRTRTVCLSVSVCLYACLCVGLSVCLCVCVCVTVYLSYRECLQNAQLSHKFVPCARTITAAYTSLSHEAEHRTRDSIAQTSCQ